MGMIKFKTQTDPATPGSGYADVFVDSADKHLKLLNDAGTLTDFHSVSAASPGWTKFTIAHTALQTSSLTNNIEIVSLPALTVVHLVAIKHSTAFAGTSITAYTIGVGIAGSSDTLEKFMPAFDVFTTAAEAEKDISGAPDWAAHGSSTSIRASAISVGANLDQSTSGSVDIWLLTSTLP